MKQLIDLKAILYVDLGIPAKALPDKYIGEPIVIPKKRGIIFELVYVIRNPKNIKIQQI